VSIVDLLIERLNQRLQDSGLEIDVSRELKNKISEMGYDPLYGARPLKRTIQQIIENPLSRQILNGEFAKGDTIQADWVGEGVSFTKQAVGKTV
jgi:ATP-dependent Clp protease ATP-binding subunit ClpB